MNAQNLFTQEAINEMTTSILSQSKPAARSVKMHFTFAEVRPVLEAAYKIEVELRNATSYQPTPDVEKMLDGVARWLTDPSTKPGLILYAAKPGVGKTTAAKAIMRTSWMLQRLTTNNDFPNDIKRDKIDSLPWWRMHTAQAITDLMNCDADDTRYSYERIFEKVNAGDALKYPSLIIDDLGIEPTEIKRFGTSIMPIVSLISDFYETQRRVVITSNLSDKAIAEKYGPRIADRLKELCERLAVGGSSFRA